MIISFILDGVISKYAPYSLFSILIFIYLDKSNLKKYYLSSFIIGLFYDFFYSHTIFFNSFIFLSCAFIIEKLRNKLRGNFINSLLISIIIILYYYSITYLILLIIEYITFDFERYLNLILNSIIINAFFVLLVCLIKKNKHIH